MCVFMSVHETTCSTNVFCILYIVFIDFIIIIVNNIFNSNVYRCGGGLDLPDYSLQKLII